MLRFFFVNFEMCSPEKIWHRIFCDEGKGEIFARDSVNSKGLHTCEL